MLEILNISQYILDILMLFGIEMLIGIDSLIFINIISNRLPYNKQKLFEIKSIIILLIIKTLSIFIIIQLSSFTNTLFTIKGIEFSIRSLLFITGSGFLLLRSFIELLETFREARGNFHPYTSKFNTPYKHLLAQILYINILLSFDTTLLAIGITMNLYLLLPIIIVSIIFMKLSYKKVYNILHNYKSVRVIAVLYMALIGLYLGAIAFNKAPAKTYLYLTVIFALITEIINIKLAKTRHKQEKWL